MNSTSKLAATPPMGWNTWNKYGCGINEELIKQTADIMVDHGYLAAGYNYLNLDDCWQSNSRDEDGNIIVDEKAFPNGIKAVADYVHSRGLKFGIYSSAGRETCAGRMASLGYEAQDAAIYAAWGVDYVKYDNCNWGDNDAAAHTRFQIMRDAIDQTGREMLFSICSWGVENTWEWASEIGHSFRTHDDVFNDWRSIPQIVNTHANVVHFSGPGRWGDPDMLEIGNGRLTYQESRSQMTLWAIMKAPLILGNTLAEMPEELYDLVTNPEIIAVNQDPLGVPATRVHHITPYSDVWVGPLADGSVVVAVVNWEDLPGGFHEFDVGSVGYHGTNISAYEIWSRETTYGTTFRVYLDPHDSKIFKLTGGTWNASSQTPILPWTASKTESDGGMFYQAEDLNNMVHGLARRRGCADCFGDARVIAIGKVNPPETGALTFRKVKGRGIFSMQINYRDCFSWTECGTIFTRRWKLRVTVNGGEPTWVSLRSSRHWLSGRRGRYSIGVVLTEGDDNEILFDNPDGNGPSIDYIHITPLDGVAAIADDSRPGAFILSPLNSGYPLASQGALQALGRAVLDYTWEWVLLASFLVFAIWIVRVIGSHRRKRRRDLEYILLTRS